jgi:hypothetical protein
MRWGAMAVVATTVAVVAGCGSGKDSVPSLVPLETMPPATASTTPSPLITDPRTQAGAVEGYLLRPGSVPELDRNQDWIPHKPLCDPGFDHLFYCSIATEVSSPDGSTVVDGPVIYVLARYNPEVDTNYIVARSIGDDPHVVCVQVPPACEKLVQRIG